MHAHDSWLRASGSVRASGLEFNLPVSVGDVSNKDLQGDFRTDQPQ